MFLAGCTSGETGPKLVAADGTVTYQGKPLAGANVMFLPENGPLASGVTDADGKFKLTSAGQPGVTAGPAKVTVTAFPPGQKVEGSQTVNAQPKTPEEQAAYMKKAEEMQRAMASGQSPPAPKSLIPESYNKPDTSGLSFTINPNGDNHFDIPLK